MNVEEHYRSTLDRLTREAPSGPDLADVLAGGRRRRRARRTAWAGGALAVAAVVTTTGVVAAQHRSSAPAGPAYQDFVPGTDIDQTLQAAVAQHLEGLPAADEVYPSDWNTPGPIPDADFADATEWHAIYRVSGVERLRVVLSDAIPGQPVDLRCDRLDQTDIPCRRAELPDGSVETTSGYLLGTSTYRFMTVHVAPDGFVVETLDDVQASSADGARAARRLTDPAVASLVGDPALSFPPPVHVPPSPAPQA
jgi:hypothetical protein